MTQENEQNMYYVPRDGAIDDSTGEDFSHLLEPEDAMAFVKRQLLTPDASGNLVATSVKLSPALLNCLENNAKVLGLSKSDLHRKALEVGLNSITEAYCSLTNQEKHIL